MVEMVSITQRCVACGVHVDYTDTECWVCGATIKKPATPQLASSVAPDRQLVPLEYHPFRYINEIDDTGARPRLLSAIAPKRQRVPYALPVHEQPSGSSARRIHVASRVLIAMVVLLPSLAVIGYLLTPREVLQARASGLRLQIDPASLITPVSERGDGPLRASKPLASSTPSPTATPPPTVAFTPTAPSPTLAATQPAGRTPETPLAHTATATAPAIQETATPTATATSVTTPDEAVHVVKPGDVCERIARVYGVSVAEIIALNELSDDCLIRVNQRLRLPTAAARVIDNYSATTTP